MLNHLVRQSLTGRCTTQGCTNLFRSVAVRRRCTTQNKPSTANRFVQYGTNNDHHQQQQTSPSSDVDNLIRFVTIDNPSKRNALSHQVLQSLVSQLKALKQSCDDHNSKNSSDQQPIPKVIILQSHGPVFSSGHDLKEIRQQQQQQQQQQQNGGNQDGMDQSPASVTSRETFELCTELMQLIRSLDQPVIAKVQGLATAAGCQLVAACDLAIASERARFATPGVKIGLFCTTPGVALARAIPRKKAMEMLLTGQEIDASEALQYGLVNKVVPHDKLEQETMDMARMIASASLETIALGKKAFYRQSEMETGGAYDFACEVMIDNVSKEDCREGIDAFVSKRKPEWKH